MKFNNDYTVSSFLFCQLVCIKLEQNTFQDPLDEVMCPSPAQIANTDFERMEGWLTSNGAIHGTVLEYSCSIGYRDSRTPCLPTRRTCHAGKLSPQVDVLPWICTFCSFQASGWAICRPVSLLISAKGLQALVMVSWSHLLKTSTGSGRRCITNVIKDTR